MQSTVIDLMRHGETEYGQIICGSTDPHLSELGWQQMSAQMTALEQSAINHEGWDICFYSPRLRCAEFAKQTCERLGIEHHCVEGIQEIHFGDWEGMTFDEVHKKFPGQWEKWISDDSENDAPHGGESNGQFQHRVVEAWDFILEKSQGKRALIFAHGGVNRVLLAHSLGMDRQSMFKLAVPFACHSRLMAYHSKKHGDWVQLSMHNSGEIMLSPGENKS